MEEREVSITKETLQQSIMRKLHMELEEEREASATAASEALSMILKLQREKAVEKMEANQYKRVTEEILQYAQQHLAVFEEAIQEKEIENLILKDEVDFYKRMLWNKDIHIIGFNNGRICECSSPREDNTLMERTGSHEHVSRTIVLPAVFDSNNSNSCLSPPRRTKWKRIGGYSDHLSDKKNKEVRGLWQTNHCNYEVNGKMRHEPYPGRNEHQPIRTNSTLRTGEMSCSSQYSPMANEALHLSRIASRNPLYNDNASSLSYQTEELQMGATEYDSGGISHDQIESRRNSCQVACVHDIFEIPENDKYPSGDELNRHFLEQCSRDTKTSLGTEPLCSQEYVKCITRYKEYLDRVSTCTNHERAISSSSAGASRRPSTLISTHSKGARMIHDPHPENSSNRSSVLQNGKKINRETPDVNEELLRDMEEQLNKIENLRKSKTKIFPKHDECHLDLVIELCFYYFF